MEGFVEDLLNMRLMREGLFEIHNSNFNLKDTLDFVVSMFSFKAESYKVHISHSFDAELASEELGHQVQLFGTTSLLPKFLTGDSRRLKQVLINLVKNAIKFTKDGSIQIKVFYNHLKAELVVRVVDTGVGIASDDLSKLFTCFGKLQRTAAMNDEGIGLGLSISKQIIHKAGGQISAHSDGIGAGSEFRFSMKMEKGTDQAAKICNRIPYQATTNKKTDQVAQGPRLLQGEESASTPNFIQESPSGEQ